MIIAFLSSCQEQYTPDTSEANQQYVVEGYIEYKEQDRLPAYVVLSRSLAFFDELDQQTLSSIYVKDAIVTVDDGDKIVALTEICLNDLPDEIRFEIANALGLQSIDPVNDLCLYIDVLEELTYEQGRRYDLRIEIEDEVLTSSTTIPEVVSLDEFRWEFPPDEQNDSLMQLWTRFTDPVGPNFYRYKTASLGRPIIAPAFSVVNDPIFENTQFEFPLDRALYLDEAFDLNTAGFYHRGDQITIHWMTLDEAHYDFWNTLEFNAANQGPFSTYTRISSNINGGLGIWGGYAISVYELEVPQ